MKFSIITANYNNGKFLLDLYDSVKKQTYDNWELIIVDDFSIDNSRSILEFIKLDNRIKVFYHESNKGAAVAFRSAASMATGEVMGMLGADDALMPNALEIMMKQHIKHPNASLICSNLYHCDEELNIISTWDKYCQPLRNGLLIYDITIGSFATFKSVMYHKTTGFDKLFKKALDHDIYLKLEEIGNVIYYDEPLYLYRSNPIGISQKNNWFEASQFSLIAKMNAHKRREKNCFEPNLTNLQLHYIKKKWLYGQSRFFYGKKKYLKSIIYYLEYLITFRIIKF